MLGFDYKNDSGLGGDFTRYCSGQEVYSQKAAGLGLVTYRVIYFMDI